MTEQEKVEFEKYKNFIESAEKKWEKNKPKYRFM